MEHDAESFKDMGPFGCGKRGIVKFGGRIRVGWLGQRREEGQLS